ncbi:MAG: hypothetical protein Q4C77_10800 [Eubacteriales bacterium]|nr:hypothetical protein [Eubacteriales bacterium]
MFNLTKKTTFEGITTIDGINVAGCRAEISSENPNDMPTLTHYPIDKNAYMENRTQCLQDYAEFLNAVYAAQNDLIAEKAAAETTEG